MARVTEIRVGVARTINLGNYESLRIEAGVTVELAEGDDVAKAKASMQPELRELLEQTYRAQHKPKGNGNAPPASGSGATQAPQQPGGFKAAQPPAEEPVEY